MRLMKKTPVIAFLLAMSLLITSCKKKEVDYEAIDLGYDYFPNVVGSYIIYEIDSTYYGIQEEIFNYQIKEVLSDTYLDDAGEPVVKVDRYRRNFNAQPWILSNTWVQKRTGTTAERIENNRRYIKLEFPIEEGGTWHGNAYNNLPDWISTYKNVDKPIDIGLLEFGQSLMVEQRNVVNLVDQEIFYEVFAKGIGMILKRNTDVNVQGGVASGYDVRYTAIGFGQD